MAYFARIANGIVQEVISISNDDCGGGEFPDSEVIGQQFIASLGIEGKWRQASYNSSFRNCYPSQGFVYDEEQDIFIPPQPFPSWTLSSSLQWESPEKYPNDGGQYKWDEHQKTWVPVDFIPLQILLNDNVQSEILE